MTIWATKDSNETDRDQLIKDAQNPEVVKGVLKEIDKYNDSHKKSYDELRHNVEDLKKLVTEKKAEIDPIIKDQIAKLSDDITTRQTEIDKTFASKAEAEKELNKRLDELEVAFKRREKPSDMSKDDLDKLYKQSVDFQVQCMAMRGEGAKWKNVHGIIKPDAEMLKNYAIGLETFMRSNSDYPERVMEERYVKALNVGSDPEGGYTVTPAMGNRIISRIFEMDPIRQLCSVETISTGAIEWMVDWGQAGYGWEGETETGSETSTADFKKKRIPVHVLYAKPRATQTLLEDSGLNIENWHADHVARRFARAEGAAFVTGDGIGKPRGFLTYADVTTAGTPEYGKIEQVHMGNAAALTYDGFVDVKYSLVEDYLNMGTWLMNRTTVAAALQLKDGVGNPIWQPGMQAGQPGNILGLPVRMSTTMPVVAAGALSVALADWTEAYMIVDRLGITVQRDPFTAKPFVEFYTRKRLGGDVVNYDAIRIGTIEA